MQEKILTSCLPSYGQIAIISKMRGKNEANHLKTCPYFCSKIKRLRQVSRYTVILYSDELSKIIESTPAACNIIGAFLGIQS